MIMPCRPETPITQLRGHRLAFGTPQERVRQIETKTMSKLRHPSRSETLRDYLD